MISTIFGKNYSEVGLNEKVAYGAKEQVVELFSHIGFGPMIGSQSIHYCLLLGRSCFHLIN